MSATTFQPYESTEPARPRFGRLLAVEFRKTTDTRAGFWVLAAVASLNLLAVLVTLASGRSSHTFAHLLHNALQPSYFILPVTAVLLVTSEFSQRTALTTFTLTPSRRRVLAAKLGACLALALAGWIVALACAALGALLGHAPDGIPTAVILQSFVYLAAAMVIGLGFGAAVLASAPAIVGLLLLPSAFSVLTNDIQSLHRLGNWLNPSTSLDKLALYPLSGTQWAQVLTTLLVWLALPLAIGISRLIRREIG